MSCYGQRGRASADTRKGGGALAGNDPDLLFVAATGDYTFF